jgi:hypothetical protein
MHCSGRHTGNELLIICRFTRTVNTHKAYSHAAVSVDLCSQLPKNVSRIRRISAGGGMALAKATPWRLLS